jgi:predicted N-acetyltransferase YhbS
MSQRSSPRAAVSVRDAGPADHPAIRDLLAAAYGQYRSVLPAQVWGSYIEDILDLDSRARTGQLIVAEQAGRIVGTVTYYAQARAEGFEWPAGWAGLRALGVEPAMRGQGIGRTLLRTCLDRALAGGAEVLCLHSSVLMTEALALYEAMGFQRAPSFDFSVTAFLGRDHPEPLVILAYRLDLDGMRPACVDPAGPRSYRG